MRPSLLAAAGFFAAGCSASEPAKFRYANCSIGCDISTPMMLDDEEHVLVTGSIPDTVAVESAAPSIVSVKFTVRTCCPIGTDVAPTLCRGVALNEPCETNETATLDVIVDAHVEGSSELRVEKADGSVWGSVTLSVERAASFHLACNNAQEPLTLAQAIRVPSRGARPTPTEEP